MRVREAVLEDVPYIADILVQVTGDRNIDNLEKDFNNPNYVYYVLENDDFTIVSYISLMISGETSDIIMVVTDRHHRGKGYASILLKEVIRLAKLRSIKEIFLEVRENNDVARNLYKKFGFIPISIRKKYYDGTIDGIVMKLTI